MKRLLLAIVIAVVAVMVASMGGRASTAHAYASTDRCDINATYANSLSTAYVNGAWEWHLGYYFKCADGDGPRVTLQEKYCSTCNQANIFIRDTANGTGYGEIHYTQIVDRSLEDHCTPQYYYRMTVNSYDNGAYHSTATPWHIGTNWSMCQ